MNPWLASMNVPSQPSSELLNVLKKRKINKKKVLAVGAARTIQIELMQIPQVLQSAIQTYVDCIIEGKFVQEY